MVDLTITVTGKSKSTQARVSLSADIFDIFSCERSVVVSQSHQPTAQVHESDEDEHTGDVSVAFVVQLPVLLSCLSLHGHGHSSETTVASLTYSVSSSIVALIVCLLSVVYYFQIFLIYHMLFVCISYSLY